MLKATRYIEQVIHADKMLNDFGNRFMVISSKEYRGKPESGIPAGTTFTLQVMEDKAPPMIDKKTNRPMDNNVFETIQVTIPGLQYPTSLVKGDFVALYKFLPEISYYIDYNLILRFGEIKKIAKSSQSQNAGGGVVTR